MNSKFIAIYPSHDASIAFIDNDGKYRILELERYKKERFYKFDNKEDFKETYNYIRQLLKSKYNITEFDVCLTQSLPDTHKEYLKEIFGINEFTFVGHHVAHAACSFYQSSFDDALIFSIDGGGFDGEEDPENRVTFFNIYLANRKTGISKLETIKYDLGTSYGLLSLPISEINKTEDNCGGKFLSFPGKMMGITALSETSEYTNHWLPIFEEYFKKQKWIDIDKDFSLLREKLPLNIGINTLSGRDAYDFAGVGQKAFENVIFECINPYLEKYKLPICLAGGCALNILFNQKLLERINVPLFIPPNPSDCGLAFGMLALHTKPLNAVDVMYNGWPILDIDELDSYVAKYKSKKVNTKTLARLLYAKKIIAVMRGDSECGPRALGNRSILCDPSDPDMKDILNKKIKHREWFRPFAPIVKLEQVNKYFELDHDARFMSYSPRVRKEWINKILSVVHYDSTSRVQTVDKKDNNFLHDLLCKFETISGQGVLLNTSFNIKGLPILTTIKDALEVLDSTELDGILIEDYLFLREL